jgi:hypothetical protein
MRAVFAGNISLIGGSAFISHGTTPRRDLKNMVWISQKSDFYIDRLSVLLQRKPKVAAPMAKLRWISKMG